MVKEGEKNKEKIIVTTTRGSRTISDIPTRVETILREETL